MYLRLTFIGMLTLLIAGWVHADSSQQQADTLSLMPPEMTKNLKALESYYAAVNQQLDKRLNRQARDPFADAGQPEEVEAKAVTHESSPFIPRQQNTSAEPLQATPAFRSQNGALPRMRFKGFISAGKTRAALLDISGIGTFVVHEKDKIGLQQLNNDMVLRIVEINTLNIIVEIGSLGEKLVVQ